jgi:hypothetical protein
MNLLWGILVFGAREQHLFAGCRVVLGQACLLDRVLILTLLLAGSLGSVVVDDPHVDAAIERRLEDVEHRRVGEFVGGDPQSIAGQRVADVFQARLEQSAREPGNLPVVRVFDVLRRTIAEFLGELLARDGAAVEPDAVVLVEFLLRANGKRDLVAVHERSRLAVHRHDGEGILGVWLGRIIAP